MHTCPVKSDLRGVDTGSVVTSGSGQCVQCQEMNSGIKGLTDIKYAIQNTHTNRETQTQVYIIYIAVEITDKYIQIKSVKLAL